MIMLSPEKNINPTMLVKRKRIGQKSFGVVGNIREGVDGIVDDVSPVPLPNQTRARKVIKGLGNFLTGDAENKNDE